MRLVVCEVEQTLLRQRFLLAPTLLEVFDLNWLLLSVLLLR